MVSEIAGRFLTMHGTLLHINLYNFITSMAEPWANCTYLVPKDSGYDWWQARWERLSGELDALETEARQTGTCSPEMAQFLIENVKLAELTREGFAMTERWHLDCETLDRLRGVERWTIDTISAWLGLSRKQRAKIGLRETFVPPDVVVRVVIPLALPHIESRRHRAWVLTVGEIISSLS